MTILLKILGWTLRASAAICIVWTTGQVIGGQISSLPVLLQSVAFHGVFALTGTQLLAFANKPATAEAAEA